jgi:hypothetical protein
MQLPDNVIITGASDGIGAALAVLFAPSRRLVLSYSRNIDAAYAVRHECLMRGATEVWCVQLDLANERSIKDFASEALMDTEERCLLVQNAGVFVEETLSDQTYEDLYLQMAVNATGPQVLTKRMLGMLGHVAFIGSDVGVKAIPGMPVYCASKYAIRGFARALSLDHPDLPVTCINPNRTATSMNGGIGHPVTTTANAIYQALVGDIPAHPDDVVGNFREINLDHHLGPPPT